MKKLLQKNKLALIGIVAGGLVGFLYWNFIGCTSGSCAITSSPINSTLYFSVMGGLFFSMFKKNEKVESND